MNDRALLILAGIGAVSVLLVAWLLIVGVAWYGCDAWERRQTRRLLAIEEARRPRLTQPPAPRKAQLVLYHARATGNPGTVKEVQVVVGAESDAEAIDCLIAGSRAGHEGRTP